DFLLRRVRETAARSVKHNHRLVPLKSKVRIISIDPQDQVAFSRQVPSGVGGSRIFYPSIKTTAGIETQRALTQLNMTRIVVKPSRGSVRRERVPICGIAFGQFVKRQNRLRAQRPAIRI